MIWVCVLIWEAGSTDTERNMLRELMIEGKLLLEELKSLCQNVLGFFKSLFCLFCSFISYLLCKRMCNPHSWGLAFSSLLVWALLQPLLFLPLFAGGGRKVKQNDRLVCVFSKVNGRTLIRKDTWGVVCVDLGCLYPSKCLWPCQFIQQIVNK